MYHLPAAPAPIVLPSGTFRFAGHWGTAYNVSGCKYFMPQKTDVSEERSASHLAEDTQKSITEIPQLEKGVQVNF